MSNLIEIGGVVVHQDANGRYSLNDLHKAAGGESRHQPALFSKRPEIVELVDEISNSSVEKNYEAVVSAAGRYGGTYVCKELVYAYAMWISPKFHLQVIRKFDEVATGNRAPEVKVIEAAKLFKTVYPIARMIGCDKQAAAISANHAVHAVSGTDLLALMGQTHMEAANQDSLFFTPSELGKRIDISGRGMNLLLAEAGLQMKQGEVWTPTEAGKDFCRIYDTGKRHSTGTPVQQVKWAENVLALVQKTA